MKQIVLFFLPLVGTSLGALIGTKQLSKKTVAQEDAMVSIATGILGTICINLTFESFAYMRNINFFIGLIFGIIFILAVSKFTNREDMHTKLFWAMLVHNIPEGMICGIALVNSTTLNNLGIIASISLQNIPDGLVVSLSAPKSRSKALILGILSGLIEPIASLLILLLAKNVNINLIEPVFLGFAIFAIYSIELDLLKECKNMKLIFISFIVATIFNSIVGC